MATVISVKNLSKAYRLGMIGGATIKEDFARWLAKARRKEDPLRKVGEQNHAREFGDTFWALQNIAFDVKQGEVLAVIGRNGAGKSTLLKILSQVTAPTSGEIGIRGRIASLLEVGTGFHPELSGRENIFLNGAILGMTRKEIRRKFDEIVAFSGIEEFIDTPVKRYSSGMYVRLAFAVAAHLEPEILILDEVLAVGDAEFQKKCLGKMGEVSRQGRTVLFVSHNIVAVKQLCQSGIWLEDGRIKERGAIASVADAYTSSIQTRTQPGTVAFAGKGDGQVELLSYRVTNAAGREKPLPGTKEDMVIEVRVNARRAIARPACGISIHNEFGVLLTSINTVEQGITLPPLPAGESTIAIRINNIAFLPGSYDASFWIMNPQGHIHVVTENSILFEIGQVPLYGTCHVDHRWGCVYSEIEFSMEPRPALVASTS